MLLTSRKHNPASFKVIINNHNISPQDNLKYLIKHVLSTMGVSKESISKFLVGNRFHVKLRILSPDNCKQSLQAKSWKAEVTAEKKQLKTTIKIS